MHTLATINKLSLNPHVHSMPAYTNKEGTHREAQISINAYGEESLGAQTGDLTLFLSLDEAQALVDNLSRVLADARNGAFSAEGVERVSRKSR